MRGLALSLLCPLMVAQEGPSPAQAEAQKAAGQRVAGSAAPGAAANVLAAQGPVAAGAQILTGALSVEIQRRVAASSWTMTMTQKFAAAAIADFFSKREKQPFAAANAKVDGLVVLTFTTKAMDEAKARALFVEGDPVKWRKTGWDRVIFTDGTSAWAFDTSSAP